MSKMVSQSAFHRNQSLVVEGFPSTTSQPDQIADLSDLDLSGAVPAPERISIVPSSSNWFRRRADGKLFQSVRSTFGRVELQSESGEFDTAVPGPGGWKSISPTSVHTYCRLPPIR